MPKQIIGGKEYEVREESFEIIREDWAEYVMASGVRVRVKPQVQKLFRILDEKANPAVRHPRQRRWLDEWGRLKGGRLG